jgi:hypothetical protein
MTEGGNAMVTTERIIELVAALSEEEVKEQLAEIYSSIAQIGIGGHTEETCFNEIRDSYRRNVVVKIIREST